MRRILVWICGTLFAAVLLLFGVVGFLNTSLGFRQLERLAPLLSDGEMAITGFSGRFPDKLRVARLEVIDPSGVWMIVENLELDWSLRGLLHRRADIDRLTASRILMLRPSDYPDDPEEDNSLPAFFRFHAISIPRFELEPPVVGTAMTFSLTATGGMSALDQGSADLHWERLDAPGSYRIAGEVSPVRGSLHATVNEPVAGLLAHLADLPGLGEIRGQGTMEGAWADSHVDISLSAGPLRAGARGAINWEKETAKLAVTIASPAMKPRADLAWESAQFDGQVDGAFAGPGTAGKLVVEQLAAGTVSAQRVTADIQADARQLRIRAEAARLRIPGPTPGLFESQPLGLFSVVDLGAPERPATFELRHALFRSSGSATTNGPLRIDAKLDVPDLAPPLAALGIDLKGAAGLGFQIREQSTATLIDVSGNVSARSGTPPLAALLGEAASFRGTAELTGTDAKIGDFQVNGKALSLVTTGQMGRDRVDLKLRLGLRDLAALTPDLQGQINLQGTLTGPPSSLAMDAVLDGAVSARGLASGPLTAELKLLGLPDHPSGIVTGRGSLDGTPVTVSISADRQTSGSIAGQVQKLDWRSLHASGAFSLPAGPGVPGGKFEAKIADLADFHRITGMPLKGSLAATIERRPDALQTGLSVEGRAIGVGGSVLADTLSFHATVSETHRQPILDGNLTANGIRAGNAVGAARIDFAGPPNALVTRLKAEVPHLGTAALTLSSTATVDTHEKIIDLASLQANWRQEVLRMRRPARCTFGKIVQVERLDLAWRQANLALDGRLAPDLDLSVELRDFPMDALALMHPDVSVDGRLQASAKLTGSLERPIGTARLDVSGVQAKATAARGLPPLSLAANAQLDGALARIEGRVAGGSNAQLSMRGEVPFKLESPLHLQADGSVELKLLDPFLMAQGRRARGRIGLNAGLRGTLAKPEVTGGLQLSQGEYQDYGIGLRLSDLSASVQSEGEKLRVDRFEAHAGPGRVDLRGTIGVLTPGLPIDLTLTARNARPLSSDRLTVTLDSNLSVRGDAQHRLAAVGNIHIRRAEIRIPEHIPATVAVLDVREPGAPPPPPPSAAPDVGVDLTVDASDEIFVRGRGLDAEMFGKIHLLGTANNPQPNGRFGMRRGQFTLMGKTMTFSRGEVGFDGGTLTNPTLDFLANTTNNNITATLNVGGTARKPKIILTSIPELPQDEILAQLLFGRGSAALSPLELAQIAGALASLTGVTSGISNPLETFRRGLGLDRLAVGSTKSGAPTLEAGRYVAPGVYLGAKQGFSGGSAIPQAAVQIDVTEGLKLEGTVGAGNNNASATSTGASSAGVLYQFEY